MAKQRIFNGAASLPALAMVLICITVAGCGQSGPKPPALTDGNLLRGVVSTYVTAQRDLGRPPQKMEELKAVLAPVDKDTEKYLRSKRDGEEFVVVWGQNLDNAPTDTIVAYERKGVNGKRMIVTRAGDTREVTPEEFAQLKFPKGHTPGG